MTTFFATSIEHLTTTKDGDKFLVSSSFAGSDGDTAKESEQMRLLVMRKQDTLLMN